MDKEKEPIIDPVEQAINLEHKQFVLTEIQAEILLKSIDLVIQFESFNKDKMAELEFLQLLFEKLLGRVRK
jgi:hypothetical protein